MARYTFDHWEVDGINVGATNPMQIGPVTADMSVLAVYAYNPITHTISVNSDPAGVTFVNPAQTVPFTLQADDGAYITLEAPAEIDV